MDQSDRTVALMRVYVHCHDAGRLAQNHRCAADARVLLYPSKPQNCAVAAVCAQIPHDTCFLSNGMLCRISNDLAGLRAIHRAPEIGARSAHQRLSMFRSHPASGQQGLGRVHPDIDLTYSS